MTSTAKRRRLSPAEYVAGIEARDRFVLARAITVIESELASDRELADEIVSLCMARTGHSRRIGITGVPGVGKSSFLEAIGMHVVELGERIAVLSVDPSSPISGGSILADKTRMEKLSNHENAFIRPSPSRLYLGGVARRTRETMLLCEAAGYNNIFVETVGVGQSETAVRNMVDSFLLLMLAGAGDDLQGIKRGIMEMVDVVAINKADGENLQPAQRARVQLEMALHFFPASDTGWTPRVLTCSALHGSGIAEVWQALVEHHDLLQSSTHLAQRRQQQASSWMHELIAQGLQEKFETNARVQALLPVLEGEVRAGHSNPHRAAAQLLRAFEGSL